MKSVSRGLCGMAASCVLIAACTMGENTPSGPLDTAALAAADTWAFRGRVAVNTQGRGVQANVRWRQTGPLAELELTGPWGLGAERVRIAGEDVLLLSEGAWLPMCEPGMAVEELEILCASAPLSSLSFWLRGLPDPDNPFMALVSGQGAAPEFQQEGWQVAVKALARSGDLTVPRRLDMSGPGATMKVVITDWDLMASP